MNFNEARTIKQCCEIAACDAYGESEVATGWLTCLEEIFDDVAEVDVLGEVVQLRGFDIVADAIVVAVVRRNKREAKITLDSLKLLSGTREQNLWLKAYLK